MTRQTSSQLSPVGKKIDIVRRRRNIALTRLAPLAKLNYSQIYRIMHGLSKPSPESLLRICQALNCTQEEAAEIYAETPFRAPSPEELEEESIRAA
jgi:transcriptional regulator with XRE-family HTH domain